MVSAFQPKCTVFLPFFKQGLCLALSPERTVYERETTEIVSNESLFEALSF